MAPEAAHQNASQTATDEAPRSSGRQPFRMSALHPRAGKASSAGVAPDLLGELQGLLPGSLTSGIGPQLGMLPRAGQASAPSKAAGNAKRARRARPEKPDPKPAPRPTRAKAQAAPQPAPRRMTADEARAFLMGSAAPAGARVEPRRRTPPIPQSIRDLRMRGFTNVYELLPDEPRLFALESVYGRWDGNVLVLDSAPTHVNVVKCRLQRATLRPYCQNETGCTYGLARLAFPLATRGILAGNVFGPMLINSNKRRVLQENYEDVRKNVAPLIRFVIKSMPNLKAIVCLGTTAHDFVYYAMTGKIGHLPKTPAELDERKALRPIFGGPAIFTTCRTSGEAIHRRGGEIRVQDDWKAVADYLDHQERPRALHKIARGKPVRHIDAA